MTSNQIRLASFFLSKTGVCLTVTAGLCRKDFQMTLGKTANLIANGLKTWCIHGDTFKIIELGSNGNVDEECMAHQNIDCIRRPQSQLEAGSRSLQHLWCFKSAGGIRRT